MILILSSLLPLNNSRNTEHLRHSYSLVFYEISVLKAIAEPILREVPDTVVEHAEAKRLLKFLDNFVAISPEEIPPTSLLREFIGGSSFKY